MQGVYSIPQHNKKQLSLWCWLRLGALLAAIYLEPPHREKSFCVAPLRLWVGHLEFCAQGGKHEKSLTYWSSSLLLLLLLLLLLWLWKRLTREKKSIHTLTRVYITPSCWQRKCFCLFFLSNRAENDISVIAALLHAFLALSLSRLFLTSHNISLTF